MLSFVASPGPRPMWFFAPLALPAQLAFAGSAAALAPRKVAWLFVVFFCAVPWLVPVAFVPLRAFCGLVSVALLMRATDLLGEKTPRPLSVRLAHSLSVADLRLAARVEPTFNAKLLADGLARAAIGSLALWFACTTPPALEPATVAVRLFLGVIGFYLAFEGIDRTAQALYLLGGMRIEATQNSPILSKTLAEFWGQRWNRIVHRWLAETAFAPFARRCPKFGLLLAFVLSAGIHLMIVMPALGGWGAVAMGGFFVMHGLLVMAERFLRVGRWPVAWARIWTLLWIILTTPLFLEPFLGLSGYPWMLDAVRAGA